MLVATNVVLFHVARASGEIPLFGRRAGGAVADAAAAAAPREAGAD